jgi:hypothetical protein
MQLHTQELGIPTANVASEALRVALSEAVTGIYAGVGVGVGVSVCICDNKDSVCILQN